MHRPAGTEERHSCRREEVLLKEKGWAGIVVYMAWFYNPRWR